MDGVNISAIISAAAGIIGVLSGNIFVAVKEYLASRSKRMKDTTYYGIIVVSHLDRFANGCVKVAYDDGTACGLPAGSNEEEYVPTVTPPEFHPLEIDVDWRLLPKDLMYSILRLPDQLAQIQSLLAEQEGSGYPEYAEFFWARRRAYADLGIQASVLVRKVRLHAGLPAEEHPPGGWDREQSMKKVIKKIDVKRENLARYNAENPIDLGF